jgi:hypothetical protein
VTATLDETTSKSQGTCGHFPSVFTADVPRHSLTPAVRGYEQMDMRPERGLPRKGCGSRCRAGALGQRALRI